MTTTSSEPVIGIDLGTTNSVVATFRQGKVEVIPDSEGRVLHPSVVAFEPSGQALVGHAARARRHIDPFNTIFSAKRLIGQSIRNPVVRLAMGVLPYRCSEGPNEQALIEVRGRQYTVPEISAFVLRYLKQLAERHLQAKVRRAVVTVPANFTDAQRQATKHAGELAGLEILRVLNEPTAAALAYGFGRALDARIAIYDLGGGTFDVTVLQIYDKVFEVLATGGDSFLGGDDFDKALLDRVSGQFLTKHNIDLRDDPAAWSRLRAACEQIKCRLSTDETVAGTVHDLAVGRDGEPLSLDFSVARNEFEELIAPYVDRSITACREVLAASGMDADRLTDLILVGGSTRTPLVRDRIAESFARVPHSRINPDETVAYGAALQAEALVRGGLDPGKFYSLLLDVCPRGLGIAVVGGFNETIVSKNTPVPVERVRKFSTSHDGQREVVIQVSQGEDRVFSANEKLGKLSLTGLEPKPRGHTVIEVTFTIDANAILNVRAKDVATGKQTQAKMEVFGAPSQDRAPVDESQQKMWPAVHG